MVELFSQLRQRPRFEAIAIFEQIRRGDKLEDILTALKDGDVLIGLSSHGSPQDFTDVPVEGHQLTLPPLRMAIPYVNTTYHLDKHRRNSNDVTGSVEMRSR
jgi:hypothetical protein